MSSTLNGVPGGEPGSASASGGAEPADVLGYDDYLDEEGDEEGDDYGGLGDLDDSSPGDYEGGNGPLDGLGVLGGPLEGASAAAVGGASSTASGAVAGGAGASVSMSLSQAASGAGLHFTTLSSTWDPSCCADWDQEKPTEQCFLRIKRDIMSIYNEPPPGMFIVPDVDNMTTLHALITGPFDTPYEGGFFYFLIRCPPDYPIRPPRLRLMSTGGGKVRFNPNLYKTGKVCLSILGTWSGPAWSPALSLSSLLMSIQSLMNEKPYHNEPGFEQERASGDAQRYNEIIRHETLRVAVCDMLEGLTPCPPSLREVMEKSFHECYAHYDATCRAHAHLTGQPMHDPFGERRGSFDYAAIARRLEALRLKLSAHIGDRPDGELSDDTSASDDISDDG